LSSGLTLWTVLTKTFFSRSFSHSTEVASRFLRTATLGDFMPFGTAPSVRKSDRLRKALAIWSRTIRLGVKTRIRSLRSRKAASNMTQVLPEPVGMTTIAGSDLEKRCPETAWAAAICTGRNPGDAALSMGYRRRL
jgi:hypothetical protein